MKAEGAAQPCYRFLQLNWRFLLAESPLSRGGGVLICHSLYTRSVIPGGTCLSIGKTPGLDGGAAAQQGEGGRQATAGLQHPQALEPPLESSLWSLYSCLKSWDPSFKSS